MTDVRPAFIVTLLVAMGAGRLAAQCPDGTPPPCRSAAAMARPSAPPPPLSIAVLPFENRSPDTADMYLADGVTEEVGNRLAQLGKLQVKARGLVAAQLRRTPDPFDAARRLGVAWFVHGNVRHVSGQLLVNVELVRATSGEEAWASRFPRRDNDVFAVQEEVAESVAVVVGGRLTPAERATIARRPTSDNEAYRLYLFGNSLFARRTQEDVARAIDAYNGAVALDPSFASAWARLGMARGLQESWGWNVGMSEDSLIALTRAGGRRALELDSTAADAWLAVGFADQLSGNLYAAHEAYVRAAQLDSLSAEAFHFYGVLYAKDCPPATCLTDPAAGIPLLRRAVALDPALRNTWRHMALLDLAAGRLAEAEAHLDTALSLGAWSKGLEDRGYVRFLRRDLAGARRDLEADQAITGVRETALATYVALLAGDSSPARAAVLALTPASTNRGQVLALSLIAMALGDRGTTLDALERLVALGDSRPARCGPTLLCSPSLLTWENLQNPIFRPLHGDARFERLWSEVRPHIPWLQENR